MKNSNAQILLPIVALNRSRMIIHKNLKVCHVASGDLLAGAEVLLLNLVRASSRETLSRTLFVVLNNGVFSRKLIEQGVKVLILEEKGFPADIQIVFNLAQFLKQEGVQVVHTHGYKSNVIGGIASRLTGSPLLIRTEHGKPPTALGYGFSKTTIFSLLDYFVGRFWTDKIVAVSHDLSRILSQRYPVEKIETIHNGIDLSQFDEERTSKDLRSEFGVSDESKLIGIFARLNPEKGIGLFLKAAKLISLKAPHAKFFIVGDGPLSRELKEEAVKLKLEKCVVFTGFREDVFDLIRQMDVVVLSSVHEGIPMVMLEAMALRKPVVATNVGGISEVIDGRMNGILVPSGDDRSLAIACLELIENPELARSLGLNARKEVEERFSAESMLDKILTLYQVGCFARIC